MESTVTTKNMISIPMAISRATGIRPGWKLDWSVGARNDELLVRVIPDRTERARRLAAMGWETDEARSTSLSYASLADRVIPVDTAVAVRALELSSLSRERLPLVDSLIAACACTGQATLVHRDPHFRAIPEDLLQTVTL